MYIIYIFDPTLTKVVPREWFSGKIQRCHRWAPSSILGSRISPFVFPETASKQLTPFRCFLFLSNTLEYVASS